MEIWDTILRIKRMLADAFLLMKTLFATPRSWYNWKAETLSFLHVLLVWSVNLASLLNKRCQSWTIRLKKTCAKFWLTAHKAAGFHCTFFYIFSPLIYFYFPKNVNPWAYHLTFFIFFLSALFLLCWESLLSSHSDLVQTHFITPPPSNHAPPPPPICNWWQGLHSWPFRSTRPWQIISCRFCIPHPM